MNKDNFNINSLNLIARFLFCLLVYVILYMANNRFQFFKPTLIPLTWIDYKVGFSPYGVYPYLFAYIFPAIVFLRLGLLRNFEDLRKFQYHFLICTITANILFFFFPTTIHNEYNLKSISELISLSDHTTGFLLYTIYQIDKPYNCLPSLHVASAFVSCIALAHDKKMFHLLAVSIAIMIAISTFMVKQHYALDAFAGLILSLLTYYPSKYLLQKYE